MFEVRVQHAGLNAYRVVRGVTQQEANLKANLLVASWDERWAKMQSTLKSRQEKLQKTWGVEANKEIARTRTEELQKQLDALSSILTAGIDQNVLHWENLKDTTPFTLPCPKEPLEQHRPERPNLPNEPNPLAYAPQFNLLDRFSSERRYWKTTQAAAALENARASWLAACRAIDASFQRLVEAHDASHQKVLKEYAVIVSKWELAKTKHTTKLIELHAQIEAFRDEYKSGNASAVEYFFAEVLNHSTYPDSFPQGNTLSFNQSSGVLIVDFELPNQSAFPTTKEVKYIAAREQFQEVPVSETWLKKTYDEVLYQIAP